MTDHPTLDLNPRVHLRTTLPWAITALLAVATASAWMVRLDARLSQVVVGLDEVSRQIERQGAMGLRRSEFAAWLALSRAAGVALPDPPLRMDD